MNRPDCVLTASCTDAAGTAATVTGFLAERGVKLVGATAHHVTTDLEDGPIIERSVARMDHTMNSAELERLDHDVESAVLNRAVRWHAQHRVFGNGSRTIVLQH
jgi:formyltetrahydrofolate deformylase